MFISKQISNRVARKVAASIYRTTKDKSIGYQSGRLIVYNCSHQYGQNVHRLINAIETDLKRSHKWTHQCQSWPVKSYTNTGAWPTRNCLTGKPERLCGYVMQRGLTRKARLKPLLIPYCQTTLWRKSIPIAVPHTNHINKTPPQNLCFWPDRGFLMPATPTTHHQHQNTPQV